MVQVRLKMSETLKEACTFIEQGHIRVGPDTSEWGGAGQVRERAGTRESGGRRAGQAWAGKPTPKPSPLHFRLTFPTHVVRAFAQSPTPLSWSRATWRTL